MDKELESLFAKAEKAAKKQKKENKSISNSSEEKGLLIKSDKNGVAHLDNGFISAKNINKLLSNETIKEKEKKEKLTAGPKWFDMPSSELTTDLKRDIMLLKMRNVLDPKRHYRKETIGGPVSVFKTNKKDSKTTQSALFLRGTIIAGPGEAKISKRNQKATIADELLADDSSTSYFKRTYSTIQTEKKSGKKKFYNHVKSKRRR